METRYTTFRSDSSLFSVTSSSREIPPKPYNFVVAGGSYAAIHAVKIICKDIIPKAVQQNRDFKARITVIAPNRETYWNVAAVRLISDPAVLKAHADQIFFPLEPTLRKYLPTSAPNDPQHELEFIQGKVLSVDSEINMLTYLKLTDNDIAEEMQDYFCHSITFNKLILATGASSSSPAFKLNGSTELTKAALREFQEASQNAKSICIVGAGGSGVELAGELGYKYGKSKKITLYSGFDRPLERLRPKIAEEAISKVKSLGVEVVLNHRAVNAITENPNLSLSSPSLHSMSDMESSGPKTPTRVESLPAIEDEPFDVTSKNSWFRHSLQQSPPSIQLRRHHSNDHMGHNPSLIRSQPSKITTDHCDGRSISSAPVSPTRTIVEFGNGCKRAFDCYIPTTGNIPNSSYLPRSSLDSDGYVLVDPYLRMAHNNPYNDIYVYGDLVSGGNENIEDICGEQREALRATLMYDILRNPDAPPNDSLTSSRTNDDGEPKYYLRRYKHIPATFYVPISRKDGVGQTMYGLPIPGFIVSIVKSKTFRVAKSRRYLDSD